MPEISKRRNSKQNNTRTKIILFRLLVVVSANILSVIVLCAFFYITDRNPSEGFGITLILLSVTDFITSYYIGRKIRKKGMLYGIAYNLPIIILFLVISLVLNEFFFDSRAIVMTVLRTTVSGVGGIAAVNSKCKRK